MGELFKNNRVIASLISGVCPLVAEVGMGACCRLPDACPLVGGADSNPSGG